MSSALRRLFSLKLLVLLVVVVAWGSGGGASAPRPAFAATPIRVAVHHSVSSADTATQLAAQLNDDTFFDFTATVVTTNQIDTVAELESYDVVVFGESGAGDLDASVAMATALRDWAQNLGGGVVSVGWADDAVENVQPRDGILDDVMPIDASPNGNDRWCAGNLGIDILGNHPVTAGISDFTLPTSDNIEISPLSPDANNAMILGTAVGDSCTDLTRNAVVVGELGPAHLVYLGPVYIADTGYDNGDLRSGPADQLLEQAVAWAALGSSDEDGDGVPDVDDECPNTASKTEVDSNGCSAEQLRDLRPNVGGAIAAILRPRATPTRQPAAAAGAVPTLGAPRTGDGGLVRD